MIMILSVIILSVLHLANFSSAIDVHYESYNCLPESSTYAANSTFQRNLNYTLFTQLVANASLHAPSSTYETGEGIDRVFAFYYCRPDLGAQVCHSCVANAATKVIAQCNLLKQGIVWYDECSLCYGGNSSVFRNNYEDVNYPKYNSTPDLGDYLEQYRNVYNSAITDLIDQAGHNVSLSFATKTVNLSSSQSLRGIVQCGPIISGESCKECLNAAYVKMTQDWTNTMMFLPACYVGFELYGSRPPLLPLSSSSTLSVRSKVLIALLCPVGTLLVLGCGFWFWKHKHPSAREYVDYSSLIQDNVELIESERQLGLVQYSYYQLEEMTSGFNKKLGEGGFATVYYGCLSDGSTEVAVKVFSKQEAPNQFSTEINVLGGISHKNLVSLIGYCEDRTILALIYEFMARGDLKSLLFEQSEALSWRKRLEIAIDVAQGLDYLHNGCCPAIVHRDVKPANILLNNKLRAKVADFGFSKIFPTEYVSNLLTRVVGTPGYLDPQYNLTGQLNEKGDVYSYGVVLLELITGKPAIVLGGTHLGVWVKSMLERGDIVSILDARLRQDVDDEYVTVWKTVELAVRCIEMEGADRPKMAQIVTELKECWNTMNAQISSSATNSTETMSGAVYSSSSLMSPSPR